MDKKAAQKSGAQKSSSGEPSTKDTKKEDSTPVTEFTNKVAETAPPPSEAIKPTEEQSAKLAETLVEDVTPDSPSPPQTEPGEPPIQPKKKKTKTKGRGKKSRTPRSPEAIKRAKQTKEEIEHLKLLLAQAQDFLRPPLVAVHMTLAGIVLRLFKQPGKTIHPKQAGELSDLLIHLFELVLEDYGNKTSKYTIPIMAYAMAVIGIAVQGQFVEKEAAFELIEDAKPTSGTQDDQP